MTVTLKSCEECHRLYSSEAGETICRVCMRKRLDGAIAVDAAVDQYGLHDISEIAAVTGLPISRVMAIVKETAALRSQVTEGTICERCHKPAATAGSRLCFECRAELNSELGETTSRMADKMAREADKNAAQPVGSKGMNVAHLTESKRRGTGFKRFNPTPRGKYG